MRRRRPSAIDLALGWIDGLLANHDGIGVLVLPQQRALGSAWAASSDEAELARGQQTGGDHVGLPIATRIC